MKKKRNRYSAGFKEQAIRRMQEGERVKALSLELQVSRGVLFEWRLAAERRPGGKKYARQEVLPEGHGSALELRIQELEAALQQSIAYFVQWTICGIVIGLIYRPGAN